MAEPAQKDAEIVEHMNHGHYVRGTMPIHEQTATFEKVFDVGLVRTGSLTVAALVLFLVLTFCAGTPFLVSLVIAVALLAVGGFVLRKPPTSDQTL